MDAIIDSANLSTDALASDSELPVKAINAGCEGASFHLEQTMEIINGLEECGCICGMAAVLAQVAKRMHGSEDEHEATILQRLQARLLAAQEREKVAGGFGSLMVPDHPINVAAREAAATNPNICAWWD